MVSQRGEFAEFTQLLLGDVPAGDGRVQDAVLGAALIDHHWGAAGTPAPSRPDPTIQQLVDRIHEREEQLATRRSALSVFVARFLEAVSGVLDEVDELTAQLAARADLASPVAAVAAGPADAPDDAGVIRVVARPGGERRRRRHGRGPGGTERRSKSRRTAPDDTTRSPDDAAVTAPAEPAGPTEPAPAADAATTTAASRPPAAPDPNRLRADYRRLAKLIAPDLGSRDDEADQARRTELLARLASAYRSGDVAAMAMVELEVTSLDVSGPAPLDPEHAARLERNLEALTARLAALDAELAELDASTMDRLRRDADEAALAGRDLVAEYVASMHAQTAAMRAMLRSIEPPIGALRDVTTTQSVDSRRRLWERENE